MRHPQSSFILLSLLLTVANGAASADSLELHADWEAGKLQSITVEELSPQGLIDLYTTCVSFEVPPPDVAKSAQISLDNFRQQCQRERKNLSFRVSQEAIDQIDTLLITRYNEMVTEIEEASQR